MTMRNLRIAGSGAYLPDHTVMFGDDIRYRCPEDVNQLDMAEQACLRALADAGLTIDDIDCIVSAGAVGVQPIPCTAALIHERISNGRTIPAFDINSTCTSFVTALDVVSYMIDAGRFNRVLIVASDKASEGLNINQKCSYELFSDGACAFVFEQTDDAEQGILFSHILTNSGGAHFTEIRGGLTGKTAQYFCEENRDDYFFDMDGRKVLEMAAKELGNLMKLFVDSTGLSVSDIDYLIPHQASRVLPAICHNLGFTDDKYINRVHEYGNQVSVSIPFMLHLAIKEGKVKRGDKVLLFGTAAGLTINMLLLRL